MGNVIIIDTENTARKTDQYIHIYTEWQQPLTLCVLTAVFQVDMC